jgi:hypothetical protein
MAQEPLQRTLFAILVITGGVIVALWLLGRRAEGRADLAERHTALAEGYAWSPIVEQWLWHGREEGHICALAEETYGGDRGASRVLDHDIRFQPAGGAHDRPAIAPEPFEYMAELSIDCWARYSDLPYSVEETTALTEEMEETFGEPFWRAQEGSRYEQVIRSPFHRADSGHSSSYSFDDVISGTLTIDILHVTVGGGQLEVDFRFHLQEVTRDFFGPRSSPTPAPPTATATPTPTPTTGPTMTPGLPPDLAATATELYIALHTTPVPPMPTRTREPIVTYRDEAAGFAFDYPVSWSQGATSEDARGWYAQLERDGEVALDITVLNWEGGSAGDLAAVIARLTEIWEGSGIELASAQRIPVAPQTDGVFYRILDPDGNMTMLFAMPLGDRHLTLEGTGDDTQVADLVQTVRLLR